MEYKFKKMYYFSICHFSDNKVTKEYTRPIKKSTINLMKYSL